MISEIFLFLTSNTITKWATSLSLLFLTLAVGNYVLKAGVKIVPLELAPSPQKANEIIGEFKEQGKMNAAIESIRRDWYFLVIYSITFAFYVFLARDVFKENPSTIIYQIGTLLIIGAFVAGFCDIIENLAMLKMLKDEVARNPFPVISSVFAGTKFFLLTCSFIYVLLGLGVSITNKIQ